MLGLGCSKRHFGKLICWMLKSFHFIINSFSCEIDTGTSTVCGAYLLIYVDYWGGWWGKKVYIPHLGDPTTSLNICPCTWISALWSFLLFFIITFFTKKIIFSAIFGPINKFLVVMLEKKKFLYALDNFSWLFNCVCISSCLVLSPPLRPTY